MTVPARRNAAAGWRRLAARAEELGYEVTAPEITRDPDLRLLVDGRSIRPTLITDDRRHVFALPRRRGVVRLLSRAAAPCESAPWLDDRRRLGVMVKQITLRQAEVVRTIPADHPALSEGWWAAEQDGKAIWRWTNGDALLPVDGDGPALLEVWLGGNVAYPVGQVQAPPLLRSAA